jgi:hypothetical protein
MSLRAQKLVSDICNAGNIQKKWLYGSRIIRNVAEWTKKQNKQTPWPEFASELYRPSDRRLSAK